MHRIEPVRTEDLIRVLDRNTLNHFASPDLRKKLSPDNDPRHGIFVRLGRVIILGSSIEHGPKVSERTLSLNNGHIYLINRGLNELGDEVKERIISSAPVSESEAYLDGTWPLVDAGNSRIDTFGNRPVGLVLFGESNGFGRVSSAVRQQTSDIAKRILGDGINVDAF